MQGGMPRPNAAIYYALDAYDTSRPHLMGRHSAGEGFLRGFVRHGGADPALLLCAACRGRAGFREARARIWRDGADHLAPVRRSPAAGGARLPVLSDRRGRRIGLATPPA